MSKITDPIPPAALDSGIREIIKILEARYQGFRFNHVPEDEPGREAPGEIVMLLEGSLRVPLAPAIAANQARRPSEEISAKEPVAA